MEGVTELATRLWFSLTSGPEIVGTPFFRVTSTFPIDRLSPLFAPELTRLKQLVSYKLLPQLMTPDPIDFIRIAESLLTATEFIDLNCGCPSPTVVGGGSGSSLLVPPERFADYAQKIVSELGAGRTSVKMRTGFTSPEEFPVLISYLSGLSLAQLTVHGRTREDRYTGKARWDLIDYASNTLKIPVIGSGDIVDHSSLYERKSVSPKTSGTIVGRGALRNPWIFNELRHEKPPSITLETIFTSLAVFGLLQTAYHQKPAALFDLADQGIFLNRLNCDSDAWRAALEIVSKAVLGTEKALSEVELHPKILARVKMIWHHLRSSLPEVLFSGTLLRETTLIGMYQTAKNLSQIDQHLLSNEIRLNHNHSRDWLYSGVKQQVAPATT